MFALAGGTVAGRDHRVAGRNNQDAFCIAQNEQRVAAIVCDGCGSEGKSEVGAEIGARIIVQHIVASDDLKSGLGAAAEALAGFRAALEKWWNDFFLFTMVGARLTPQEATFFSIGDGLIVVNGERIPLGPFPNNAPPYLGYDLARAWEKHLVIHRLLKTDQLTSFLLATDGIDDLIAAEGKTLAGRTDTVEPIDAFWTDGRFFKNPDAIRRRLALISREHTAVASDGASIKRTPGFLRDDTTLIVGKRKE